MIGNGHPYGKTGYVILEEGQINPQTWQLDVAHYLVVKPNGDPVSGHFSFSEAQSYIDRVESKLQ